jgi:hypothetical protein
LLAQNIICDILSLKTLQNIFLQLFSQFIPAEIYVVFQHENASVFEVILFISAL